MSKCKRQSNRNFPRLRLFPSRLAVFAILIAFALSVRAQETDKAGQDHFDIRSSAGDLHLGNDADARAIGLPLYPGARVKHDEKDSSNANLAIATEAFAMKLLIARYDSDDPVGKIVAYYKEKLKKYGDVIECRTHEHGGDIHSNSGKDHSNGSKPVKCDDDNTGNIIELKVGTEDNQHEVAVEAADKTTGSTFALIYVHTRGKQGDI